MIVIEGLRKKYGDFLAVADSSLTVDEGEIVGLVGPNGAGKTTTLKILSGLIEPTAGTATVAGYDVQDPAMRSALGFLPEESPLYEEMTARSYLHFFADLYDVDGGVATERIESTLDDLDLEHRDRALGDVSKGMKRKVAIARSLVNDPDVLVYDEPASGLDPLTTNYVLEFISDLADNGRTVLLSAHNLYHVEDVCDRVAVMNEGRIIARGSVSEIRSQYGETSYRVFTTVSIPDSDPEETTVVTGTGQHGRHQESTQATDSDPEELQRHVATVQSMEGVERCRAEAEAAGGRVVDIRTREPSLEEIFLKLAEKPVPDGRRNSDGTEEGPASTAGTDGASGKKGVSAGSDKPSGTNPVEPNRVREGDE